MKFLVTVTCLIACCIAVQLLGCGDVRVTAPRAALPQTTTMGPPAPSAADHKIDTISGELAANQAQAAELRRQLAQAKQDKADEAWAWAHTLVHWCCALAILVGLAAAGAGAYFRCKALLGIAGACAAVVCVGFATDWLLYHRTLAVCGVLTLAAGALGMLWLRGHQKTKLALDGQDALAAAMRAISFLNPKTADMEIHTAKQRVVDEIMAEHADLVEALGVRAQFSGALPAIDQRPPTLPPPAGPASSPPPPAPSAG